MNYTFQVANVFFASCPASPASPASPPAAICLPCILSISSRRHCLSRSHDRPTDTEASATLPTRVPAPYQDLYPTQNAIRYHPALQPGQPQPGPETNRGVSSLNESTLHWRLLPQPSYRAHPFIPLFGRPPSLATFRLDREIGEQPRQLKTFQHPRCRPAPRERELNTWISRRSLL